MHNSIALPIPPYCDQEHFAVREFIEGSDGWKEIRAISLSWENINQKLASHGLAWEDSIWAPDFTEILWFPEEWPPGRIEDWLTATGYQLSILESGLC